MPDAYAELLVELEKKKKGSSAQKEKPDDAYADLLKKIRPEAKPPADSSFVGDVIKKAAANTSVGLLARATGVSDYEEKDLGTAGNIAAGIGSFVADPVTYLTGGVGGALAKGAATKYGAGKIAQGAIAAGTQFGGLEGTKELIRSGDPVEALKAGAEGAAAGAMFGPAGAIGNPILRTAAEVGTMAATGPILEGRNFTKDDWVHAAGTVGGFKLAHAIGKAVKGLKPGEDPKPAIEAEIGPEEAAKVEAAVKSGQVVDNSPELKTALEVTKEPPLPLAKTELPMKELAEQFKALYPERAAQIAAIEGPFVRKYIIKKMSGPSWEIERDLRSAERNELQRLLREKPDENEIKTSEEVKDGSAQEGQAVEAQGPQGEVGAVLGEATAPVPRETKLSKAAQEHKAKAAELFAELEGRGQKLGSTGGGVDPKSIAIWLKATSHEIRAAGLNFADYVAKVAEKFGREVTVGLKNLIRETWESHRTNDPKLEPAGDVDAILSKIETKPVEQARPDLANPGVTPVQREFVNAVDALRNAIGEPQRIPQAEMRAKAEERFRLDPEGERAKLRDPNWVPAEQGADTAAAGIVFKDAVDRWAGGDTSALNDAVVFVDNYRSGRGNTARELANGWDRTLTPKERMGLNAAEALFQPPEAVTKKIKNAAKNEKQAEVEATQLEPGTTPRKPRTTAKKETELWGREVERLRKRLEGLGHNVDAALRGELDPIAHREFMRDAHALKATKADKLYEWWSNSILSGPATQVTNAVGNVAHASWYFTAERITESVLNSMARGLGMKTDGATFGELKYAYRAFVENWGKSAKNFFETFHSEIPQFKFMHGAETKAAFDKYGVGSIAGKKGKAIRTPWRLLAAVDDFVKSQVYEMERSALAYRQAKSEGISKENMTARMRELLDTPGSMVNQKAVDTAIRLAFQESTKAAEKTSDIVRSIPGGRYVLPFITTPFNILKTGIRKSPFGSIKLAKEVIKASQSGDWSHVSPRVAEQVLAWGATLALAYSNDPANPWITGGDDPNRKYAIKIGGQWYNYSRVEPFATTLGLLVDGINKLHEGKDLYESLKAPFDALIGRVDDQTFFAGISDLMKAARYREAGYVFQWASKFPASWVPNLVRAPIRNTVGEVPERRVWAKGNERVDRILDRGLKAFEVMPDYPRWDNWGRPVPKDGSPLPHTDWLFRTLSPVGERKYVETIGDRLIQRWNAANPQDKVEFKAPNPYFTDRGETKYFTDAEYNQYVRESGKLTQERIIALQAGGGLNMNNPTERDIKRLRKIIESSRTRVRNSIERARRKAEKNAA